MLKVYGFPRSGTHLAMELLARNFYPDADLETPAGEVGHYANRAMVPPVQFGKLAGHHGPPAKEDDRGWSGYLYYDGPPLWGYERGHSIYVYRDARAVLASLWRSPHFKHPAWETDDGVTPPHTFSDYLRFRLDWRWSPALCAIPRQKPIEHWIEHLQLWWEARCVLKVSYEKLVQYPEHYLEMIMARFDLPRPDKWTLPNGLVGHFPSGGTLDGWRDLWSEDDEALFLRTVPDGFYGVYRDDED